MHIYFATNAKDLEYFKKPINALLSFYYISNKAFIFNNKLVKRFFIDSGGFTAFTKNEVIDIQEYIQFIKQNKGKITVYAVLDDIKDPEKTLQNQKIMEKAGLNPLPVFHYGEDFKYLDYYIKNYNYIAIGGLVPISSSKIKMRKFLNEVFSKTKDKIKVHGFGVQAFWALKRYPFYSIDSSSWSCSYRFGRILNFNQNNGKIITFNKKNKSQQTIKILNKDRFALAEENIKTILDLEDYITRLWEKRGIIWD